MACAMSGEIRCLQFYKMDDITLENVKKELEMTKDIKPISSIGSIENGGLMGIYVSHRPKPNTDSICITLREVTVDGTKGSKFFVTLDPSFRPEWCSLYETVQMNAKSLIIFQNVYLERKEDRTAILFDVSKTSVSNCGQQLLEKCEYVQLSALKSLETKSNIYSVVIGVVEEPIQTGQGKGRSRFLIVDPSCYGNTDKTLERVYCVHFYGSSLAAIPRIKSGDIIRVHQIYNNPRQDDDGADFVCYNDNNFVVFPLDDLENARAGVVHVTQNDVQHVKQLKAWSLEQSIAIEQKTLSEIRRAEVFDLDCIFAGAIDEGEKVTLLVEDGTQCPLYTFSKYDIHAKTIQNISRNCPRVFVRCFKQSIEGLTFKLGIPLRLRAVQSSTNNCETEKNVRVVQFKTKGAIEILQEKTKSLMQEQNKFQGENSVIQSYPSGNSTEKLTTQETLQDDDEDDFLSCGESSIEKAMRDMSSGEFCKKETLDERSTSPLVPWENVDSPPSLTELPNLISSEDISSIEVLHVNEAEAMTTSTPQKTTDFPSNFSPDETEVNGTGCQIENKNLKRTLPRYSQLRILSSDPKLFAVSEVLVYKMTMTNYSKENRKNSQNLDDIDPKQGSKRQLPNIVLEAEKKREDCPVAKKAKEIGADQREDIEPKGNETNISECYTSIIPSGTKRSNSENMDQ